MAAVPACRRYSLLHRPTWLPGLSRGLVCLCLSPPSLLPKMHSPIRLPCGPGHIFNLPSPGSRTFAVSLGCLGKSLSFLFWNLLWEEGSDYRT